MRKIYVATSWRNPDQPEIIKRLRTCGHQVYDFMHPVEGESGFSWSEIDPDWQSWSPDEYREGLNHPLAEHGFNRDMDALDWADTVILVQPCGRSAHLEFGYASGQGKARCILLSEGQEPELMAKMASCICSNIEELLKWLHSEE